MLVMHSTLNTIITERLAEKQMQAWWRWHQSRCLFICGCDQNNNQRMWLKHQQLFFCEGTTQHSVQLFLQDYQGMLPFKQGLYWRYDGQEAHLWWPNIAQFETASQFCEGAKNIYIHFYHSKSKQHWFWVLKP